MSVTPIKGRPYKSPCCKASVKEGKKSISRTGKVFTALVCVACKQTVDYRFEGTMRNKP